MDIKVIKDQILTRHNEMRKIALLCGIKEIQYDNVIKDIDKLHDSENELLYKTITTIHSEEYFDVKEIWDELPERIWNQYFIFGLNSLDEVRQLRLAQKLFRQAWTNLRSKMKTKHQQIKQGQSKSS